MKPIYKILIAVGAAILLAGILYGIWWLFFASPTPTETPPAGTLPGAGGIGTAPSPTSTIPSGTGSSGGIKAISDRSVFDYWLVPDTGEIYYLTPEGYVYAARDGDDLEISHQTIAALNRVVPSSDGRRLLAAFGNPLSPQWGIFDTVDAVWRPLPREIRNAGWGRNEHELIAVVANAGQTDLSLVDVSKNPVTFSVVVRNFAMEDVGFSPLSDGTILVAERASAAYAGRAWRLDPGAKTFSLALSPAAGLSVRADARENVSYLSSSEGGFSIADGTLANQHHMIFSTSPEKCAAAAHTIWCFAPKNTSGNPTLPDDYLTHAFYSVDGLYSVSQDTFAIAPVPLPSDAVYDATDVRADKKAVYFVDRYTGSLFSLAH